LKVLQACLRNTLRKKNIKTKFPLPCLCQLEEPILTFDNSASVLHNEEFINECTKEKYIYVTSMLRLMNNVSNKRDTTRQKRTKRNLKTKRQNMVQRDPLTKREPNLYRIGLKVQQRLS